MIAAINTFPVSPRSIIPQQEFVPNFSGDEEMLSMATQTTDYPPITRQLDFLLFAEMLSMATQTTDYPPITRQLDFLLFVIHFCSFFVAGKKISVI